MTAANERMPLNEALDVAHRIEREYQKPLSTPGDRAAVRLAAEVENQARLGPVGDVVKHWRAYADVAVVPVELRRALDDLAERWPQGWPR
jgi:hypothetical protein